MLNNAGPINARPGLKLQALLQYSKLYGVVFFTFWTKNVSFDELYQPEPEPAQVLENVRLVPMLILALLLVVKGKSQFMCIKKIPLGQILEK